MDKKSVYAGIFAAVAILTLIALLVGVNSGYEPGSTSRLRCDSCLVYTVAGPVATGDVVHMSTEDMARGACAAITGNHPDFVGLRQFNCQVPDSVVQTRPK